MSKTGAKAIIKNSSIVAGAQVFQIIFGIIRTKLIAILLGPVGVGQSGLYQSVNQLIISIFGLGISQSSVKTIAENKQNNYRLNLVISTSIILTVFLGLLSIIFTIFFSKEISLFTFKTEKYSLGISVISISIILNMLYACLTAIAQGLRKLKIIALISIYSSVISLFTTIPIYYFWGINGIVPALSIMSITNLIISIYYVKPIFNFVVPTIKEFKNDSIEMIKIGIALAFSGFFLMASNYFIRTYITDKGGIVTVGFLNAATAITTLYLSLIFTAMSTDFYPKLASLNKNSKEMNNAINEQIHVGLIIAGPIIICFISFASVILTLLYSNKFSFASELLQYQLLGTLFKAFSWPIGFLLLTNNLSKIFIFTEFFWNFTYYILTIILWKYIGLSSVGISYLISYFLLTIVIYIIAKWKNSFKFTSESIMTFLIFLFLSLITFLTIHFINNLYIKWILVLLFILLGSFYSIMYLKKVYNITSILNNIKDKIIK